MTLKYYFVFLIVIIAENSVIVLGDSLLICGTQTTCADCLYIHEDCAWCSKWDDKIQVKCNSKQNLIEAGCEEEYIETSEKSSKTVVDNKDLKDEDNNGGEEHPPVQLQPQYFKIKLRPNDEIQLPIKVRPARNYPLDLYFLMDASYSMNDDVNTIIRIGGELMKSLANLTENFRLGLGSFSDKPTMPWTQIDPLHLQNPCLGDGKVCLPPYEFKHLLSLTNDMETFMKQIRQNMITGNLDNVDGGLDALLQVLVCGEKIGWLNNTRRIIIMATDSLFHTAGDGKLGGIVYPHDGKCYLDETGFYSKSLNLDYPSVSQIHKYLNKNKINVIFAVTQNIKSIYDQLHDLIPKTTYVALLEEDSSNILELLKQGYERIASKLNLQDNSTDPIHITYFSDCNQKNGQFVETFVCRKVQSGQIYEFLISLKLSRCPMNANELKQRFIIEEANLGNENIIVDVEMICGCSCTENVERNSSKCENHGNNVCGLCECNKPWLGKYCECNSVDFESSIQLQDLCRPKNSIHKCSQKGECVCGQCICDNNYYGQYCECEPCDIIDGKICNNHGICKCGQCVCQPDYTGRNCDCSLSKKNCIKSGDVQECHGHGVCECGRCVCNRVNANDFYYVGQFCQETFNASCTPYQSCVQCVFDKDVTSCKDMCSGGQIPFDIVHYDYNEDVNEENACIFRNNSIDGSKCDYKFNYNLQTNGTIQLMLISKECDKELVAYVHQLWPFLVGVFLFYVLVVAIIKIRNMRQDYLEYVRFQKNRQFEKQEMNPLYISPTTHHEVPMEVQMKKTE